MHDRASAPKIKRVYALNTLSGESPIWKPQRSFIPETAGAEIMAQCPGPEGKLSSLPRGQHSALQRLCSSPGPPARPIAELAYAMRSRYETDRQTGLCGG